MPTADSGLTVASTGSNRARRRIAAAAVMVVVPLAASACGSNAGEARTNAAADSAYCDEASRWAAHEIDQVDDSDPVAFRRYSHEYLAFSTKARRTAPSPIRGEWDLKVTAEARIVTPVLEKYHYDMSRLMREGTDAEKAAMNDAPPDVQRAQNVILGYEADVCGAQQPLAAKVTFAGETAGRYCEVVATENERISKVFGAGAKPADVKVFFAGEPKMDARLAAAAPASIREDVKATTAWTDHQQADVLRRHGWDVRKLLVVGPPRDRAEFNYTDPAVRQHSARVRAYQEQVCGP